MRGQQGKSVAEAFAEAMHAYQSGKSAEARRLAKRIADQHPDFGGVHYLLGLLAIDRGQGKTAATHLAKAITITPGQAVLHMAMGRALEIAGSNAEACLHYRTVLSLMPAHAEAHARLAEGLRLLGKTDEAISHYRQAVAADPAHAEAWNGLGALLQESGAKTDAADALRRALALRPDWPAALNNYGVTLKEIGRLDEAALMLEGAVELRPDHAASRANLAAVYRAQGRFVEARAQAEAGMQTNPRNTDIWIELGLARQAERHWEGAAVAFERATVLSPRMARAWFCLGEARRAEGNLQSAQSAYRRCLDLDPDDHLGAALGLTLAGGTAPPAKPPEAYVRKLFDEYADRFDEALVEKLHYQAPALLARAVAEVMGPAQDLRVFDAGCGTGLAAVALKPWAARIEGCDLSPVMVAKARERGLYDKLSAGDAVQTLAGHDGTFDLVVAADVLVYLGDLSPMFQAAHRALAPNGLFAFTAERTDDRAWVLGAKHRYAHSGPYLQAQAKAAGFDVCLIEEAVTRQDGGEPVPGWLVVLRRA